MLSNNERDLRSKLSALTQEWTYVDWKKVRNIDYFFSDYMPIVQALIHKIERIEYYNQNGVVKPYSAPKIEMLTYDLEHQKNKAKSLLDPSKKESDDDSDEPFV